MKLRRMFAGLVLCLVPVAQQSFAAALNLSTGQNSGGSIYGSGGQTDANWTVDPSGCTDPGCGAPVAAVTTFPNDADWYGGWLANDSSSDWITRDQSVTNNGPAPYAFYDTFDLADTTGASISGSWAIDDSGVLILNGKTIATLGSGAWGGLTAFSDSTASDFNAGANTLEIQITSDDQFLEGVRLTGTLNGDVGSAPEPATLPLLIGGLLLAAGAGWIRRRSTQL